MGGKIMGVYGTLCLITVTGKDQQKATMGILGGYENPPISMNGNTWLNHVKAL